MMVSLYTCICCITFICLEIVWSIMVQLNGPPYVRRHQKVVLNCSTDTSPIGLAAELQVNSKSFVDVRYYDTQCFSTQFGRCPPSACNCSPGGTWFTHTYQVNQREDSITFTCVMRYGNRGSYSKSITVKIFDIFGPIIQAISKFPLHYGNIAEMECIIISDLNNISLLWTCDAESFTETEMKQFSSTMKILSLQVEMLQDDRNCTCSANAYGLLLQSSVILTVTNQSEDKLIKIVNCNASNTVILTCLGMDSNIQNGICIWEHSYRGSSIRQLKGQLNNSSIKLEPCSYEDNGDYTCSFCEINGTNVYVNKSTRVIVDGPPNIVQTTIVREQILLISVVIHSESGIKAIDWLLDNKPIINSTETLMSLSKTQITMNIYNRNVRRNGFTANLTTNSSAMGNFTIITKNYFGTTKRSFIITSDSVIIDLRIFIFGIIACTIIVTKARPFRHQVHIIGPFDHSPAISVYHSAPQTTPNVHLYEEAYNPYLDVVELETQPYYLDSDLKDTSKDASTENPYLDVVVDDTLKDASSEDTSTDNPDRSSAAYEEIQ